VAGAARAAEAADVVMVQRAVWMGACEERLLGAAAPLESCGVLRVSGSVVFGGKASASSYCQGNDGVQLGA
jgi:hypothetical protein